MKISSEYISLVFKDKSSYLLIAMNLFPIFGVLLWEWEPVSLIFIYIAETIVIGILNFFKMLFSKAKVQDKTGKIVQIPFLGNLFIGLFFLFHFNAFNYGQIELFTSFIDVRSNSVEYFINSFVNDDVLMVALLIILVSHLFSFYQDFIKREQYDFIPALIFLFLPYPRIFVQQFVGVFGAFFVMVFNLPLIFLILLQVCKTIAELFSHILINEKFEKVIKAGNPEELKAIFSRLSTK